MATRTDPLDGYVNRAALLQNPVFGAAVAIYSGKPRWEHHRFDPEGGGLGATPVCDGMGTGTLTWSLRRAFQERPDVVVVLSDSLGTFSDADRKDSEDNLPELRSTYADPLDEMARWEVIRPVIAIGIEPLGRQHHPPAAHELPAARNHELLRRLADKTGGRYVDGGAP